MKKFPLILVSTAVLAALALPAALGVLAERRHAEMLAALTGEPGAGEVVVEAYRRGWLDSTARYRVPIERNQGESAPRDRRLELIVDSRIMHGPLPLSGGTEDVTPVLALLRSTLVLDNGDRQWQLPGVIETRIGLGGNGNLRYRTGPVEEKLPGGQTLTWEGADALLHFDAPWQNLVADGRVGRLRVVDDDSRFLAGPTRLAGTLTRPPNGSWAGRVEADIDQMAHAGSIGPGAGLAAVSIESRLDYTGDGGYAFALRAAAGSVRSGDWHGGNAVLDLTVAGPDRAALPLSLAGLREHAVSATPGAWKIDAEAAWVELQPILQDGVAVELKEITFPTRHGDVTARMSLALSPQEGPVELRDMPAPLDAGLSLRLPRILVDSAAEQDGPNGNLLRNLLRHGLLESSEEHYAMAARYANGILTVNGASLPVPSRPSRSQRSNVELKAGTDHVGGE